MGSVTEIQIVPMADSADHEVTMSVVALFLARFAVHVRRALNALSARASLNAKKHHLVTHKLGLTGNAIGILNAPLVDVARREEMAHTAARYHLQIVLSVPLVNHASNEKVL